MLEIQNRIGVWAHHQLQSRNFVWKAPWRQWIEDKYVLFLESLYPRCWHKSCKNRGEPCLLRGYGDGEEDQIYWYCAEHSQRHGFCYGCGEFWGGTESFDFGPGYCSNCASEFEEEELEDDWTYEL